MLTSTGDVQAQPDRDWKQSFVWPGKWVVILYEEFHDFLCYDFTFSSQMPVKDSKRLAAACVLSLEHVQSGGAIMSGGLSLLSQSYKLQAAFRTHPGKSCYAKDMRGPFTDGVAFGIIQKASVKT